MSRINKNYTNPRLVNQQGGILLESPSGRDLYIDATHPQYDEVIAGDFGEVTEMLVDISYGLIDESGFLLNKRDSEAEGYIQIPDSAQLGQQRQDDGTFITVVDLYRSSIATKKEIYVMYDSIMQTIKNTYSKSEEEHESFLLKFSAVDEYNAGGVLSMSWTNREMMVALTNSPNINDPAVENLLSKLSSKVAGYKTKIAGVEYQRDKYISQIVDGEDNSELIQALKEAYEDVAFALRFVVVNQKARDVGKPLQSL